MDGTQILGALNQYKGMWYENNHWNQISYGHEQSSLYSLNIP